MEFVIRDGDWYVSRKDGKYSKTKDIGEALRFDSEAKCDNVIRNSLSKALKKEHEWKSFQLPKQETETLQEVKVEQGQPVWVVKITKGYFGFQESKPVLDACLENAFQFKSEESCNRILQALSVSGEKGIVESCVSGQRVETWNKDLEKGEQYRVATHYQVEPSQLDEFMLQLVAMYVALEESYADMKEQYAQSEAKVVDYYHAIEFYDLNAADGFGLYRGLKQALRERRKLKNDLKKIAVLKRTCLDPEKMEQLQNEFPATNQSNYVPRILTEIFKGR